MLHHMFFLPRKIFMVSVKLGRYKNEEASIDSMQCVWRQSQPSIEISKSPYLQDEGYRAGQIVSRFMRRLRR